MRNEIKLKKLLHAAKTVTLKTDNGIELTAAIDVTATHHTAAEGMDGFTARITGMKLAGEEENVVSEGQATS